MDFYSTLIANGFNPKEVVPDGRFRRCSTTDKPRKRNGAYVFHVSGRRGYFHNYAIDDQWHEWRDDRPMSPIERKQVDRETAAFRRKEAEDKRKALQSMLSHLGGLKPLREGHPYLDAKGLSIQGCTGCRVDGDLLVIPASKNGQVVTFQTIAPDGAKKYRYGCSIAGASYAMTRRSATITCFVEGFATGLAIYQSIPDANVIVAFDAGNLARVAKDGKYKGMCVVCADNDWETEERIGLNTGLKRGNEAAEAIGCGVAYPEGINGTDWADALAEWGDTGKSRVKVEIMRKVRFVI